MYIVMLLSILTTMLHSFPAYAVEVSPKQAFKKEYSHAQLNLLEYIHKEWDNHPPHTNNVIRRWDLVKDGIRQGLHPDDITGDKGSFLFTLFLYCSPGDPHEDTLHKTQLLLEHNASPNCFHNERSTLCFAPTYAIAKCLLEHGANLTTPAHGIAPENTGTMLHELINDMHGSPYFRMDRTPSDISRMIALYCKAGVNPKQTDGDFLSPLTYLVKHSQAGNSHTSLGLAETLVQVGAPIDGHLNLECSTVSVDDPITPIVALKSALRERAERMQQHVEIMKQTLRTTRSIPIIEMLQNLKFLSKDPAAIVAEYDSEIPHEYYIDQILARADDELQAARTKRAAQAQKQCWCIIQ